MLPNTYGSKIVWEGQQYISSAMDNTTTKTKIEGKRIRGLGVFSQKGSIYLFYHSSSDDASLFRVAKSADGFDFKFTKKGLQITKTESQLQDMSLCSDFEMSSLNGKFHMFYKQRLNPSWIYIHAFSENMYQWKNESVLQWAGVTGTIVPEYLYNGMNVMYVGGKSIYIATSDNLSEWKYSKNPVFSARSDHFDNGDIEVEHSILTDRGILVLYHSKKRQFGYLNYKVGAVLFNKDNPSEILWRASEPLWDTTQNWIQNTVAPIGIVLHNKQFISYWNVEGEGIFSVVYSLFGLNNGIDTKNVSLRLKRAPQNPMIAPNHENNWEAFNTFNPAAFYEDGRVHLLYRAQGFDYISVLGYATSTDGITVDYRASLPAFTPHEPFDTYIDSRGKKIKKKYMSGGGYGGSEDPRITLIDDRLYVTYVAFDGYNPPRVALTSISLEDFKAERWLWEKPVLISPPGVVDKNACIFPEKINGKYVILHRIYPDILIDFVDSLAFDGSTWLKGEYKISPRKDKWDSRKIGAGPPPIKTPDGWLLIYQAVGNQDAGRYKIGAMLLDLNDPTTVLHRSNAPILEPREKYENEGFKNGVIYPCGAVVIDGILHVYYGGADSYVCVATAVFSEFLAELKHAEIAKLDTVILQKVLSTQK